MERSYYEAYDDRYRQVHRENLKWFAEDPSRIVMDVIQKYGVSGTILEIGCGEGRDAAFLRESGLDVLATDLSVAAIDYCRNRWPEWKEQFCVLDCLKNSLDQRFDFIYAVAVIHMLVKDEDRARFYQFIRTHLQEEGIALVCSMGDGMTERSSDISQAFALQERVHEPTGRRIKIAGTSYRAVSFASFRREIEENGLHILREGLTNVEPDYGKMMYAVVRKG